MRQLRTFVIFWAVCLSACGSGPKLKDGPCVLDPPNSVGYCAPPGTADTVDKPISEMGNYTCFSPQDLDILVTWIKTHKSLTPAQKTELLQKFTELRVHVNPS